MVIFKEGPFGGKEDETELTSNSYDSISSTIKNFTIHAVI
jgi:hypothetical protein